MLLKKFSEAMRFLTKLIFVKNLAVFVNKYRFLFVPNFPIFVSTDFDMVISLINNNSYKNVCNRNKNDRNWADFTAEW